MVSLAERDRRPLWTSPATKGFSFVELLITVVLAGIVFAALVPLFLSAEKASAGDRSRNIANKVAQDRIEKIRLLSFDQIVSDSSHLQSSSFAGGQFGPTFTPAGSSKPYAVSYTVENVPSTGAVNYKRVSVTVTWTAPPAPVQPVTMFTIVMNPTATSASSSPSPSPSPSASPSPSVSPTPTPSATTGAYKLTVIVTTSNVNAGGVTVVRTDVTPNQQQTPTLQIPTVGSPVYWAGLPGGSAIRYLVTCNYKNNKTITQTITLTGDQTLTFDTKS